MTSPVGPDMGDLFPVLPLSEQGPSWFELVDKFGSHFDEQQLVMLMGVSGQHVTGSDVTIRVRAARATQWLYVHVQNRNSSWANAWGDSWGTSWAGGFADSYVPGKDVYSALIDCRQARQQDIVITRNGANHYFAWIAPVFEHQAGQFTYYDGVDGPDHMLFFDLGV